jgi:RimJ/RimL family protein N-acetyltransferase
MKLIDAYGHPQTEDILWGLLFERTPQQSISHKRMPTVTEHRAYIASKPHQHWYLIDCGDIVGAIYLSHQREIGIGILHAYRGKRYAPNAVRMLMERHPGRFLANINPANEASISLFRGLGFRQIQVTYELD